MYQMSIFDGEKYTLSALLKELNKTHQEFYFLVQDEQEREYTVVRYDGDIILCVFKKTGTDGDERTIAKSVYLTQTNQENRYLIVFFDSKCLPHLVDIRTPSVLLEAYVFGQMIYDDLGGKENAVH